MQESHMGLFLMQFEGREHSAWRSNGCFPSCPNAKNCVFEVESHNLMAPMEEVTERRVSTSKRTIWAWSTGDFSAMGSRAGAAICPFPHIAALKVAIFDVKAMISWPQGSS